MPSAKTKRNIVATQAMLIMATKIRTGFFTVLFFFAVVNMSQIASAKWDITEILSLSGITGAEICKTGDIYNVVLCGPTHNCQCCTNWCNGKCRGMGSSMLNQKCTPFTNSKGSPTLTCECCCKNMSPPPPSPPPPSPPPPPPSPPPPSPPPPSPPPPSPSPPPPSPPPPSPPPPSPSPPPPSPPPSPPPQSEVCKPGDIHDVVLCGPTTVCDCCTNWCENKCKEMGSSVANQKCTKFINSEGSPTTTCDCCCKNMSPPPPSPPPFCCPKEMDIRVSPDQAPCKYTLSPSITTYTNKY